MKFKSQYSRRNIDEKIIKGSKLSLLNIAAAATVGNGDKNNTEFEYSGFFADRYKRRPRQK